MVSRKLFSFSYLMKATKGRLPNRIRSGSGSLCRLDQALGSTWKLPFTSIGAGSGSLCREVAKSDWKLPFASIGVGSGSLPFIFIGDGSTGWGSQLPFIFIGVGAVVVAGSSDDEDDKTGRLFNERSVFYNCAAKFSCVREFQYSKIKVVTGCSSSPAGNSKVQKL